MEESISQSNSTTVFHPKKSSSDEFTNGSELDRPLGSEISCTYAKTKKPSCNEVFKEQQDSGSFSEVSSVDQDEKRLKLNLGLTLWTDHEEQTANANSSTPEDKKESSMSDYHYPPPKSQAVGWPPVRTYRKNSLGGLPKSFEDDKDGHETLTKGNHYVKVNMDGMAIGRKIDLNVFHSYEGLANGLEKMFQRSNDYATNPMGREGLRLLDPTAEYVLTYEDSEGDWMLVGDVPWMMFVETVRRLRIMKNSDSNLIAQRGPKKGVTSIMNTCPTSNLKFL